MELKVPFGIREAHGGTLFLDEIGDMPVGVQACLLRVLQERQVVPLGGGKPIAVDFALVCATHRPLKADTETGRFRADLYYRINGLALALPPLRDRSDLQTLIARLLEDVAPNQGLALHTDVAAAFGEYRWPGNLRQLANALRTACALIDDGETRINWHHLPDDLVEELRNQKSGQAPIDLSNTENLRSLSDTMIGHTVSSSGGNMSEAARRLGISRNTLYRRLKSANR